ncbi:MAG: GNAT family protein [Spirochaetota bacterium]
MSKLIIRKATLSDAEQLIKYVNTLISEPEICLPLTPGEFNQTVEAEKEILEKYSRSDNSIFLVAAEGNQIVGVLNCKGGDRIRTRHSAEIGISVRSDYRNRGIGTRLLSEAIRWAKSTHILTRLELRVYTRNAPAIHLYAKLGFKVEGHRKNAVYQAGKYEDDFIMALLF